MKALIVEDEKTISRILARKLKVLGYECQCTESISGAKNMIEEFSPDLIFLDYILVDGRSSELAVEGYLKGIKNIFLMSAFMDNLNKNDFKGLEIKFLPKPFEDLDSFLREL